MNANDQRRREAEKALGNLHDAAHKAKEACEHYLRAYLNREPFWGELENSTEADHFSRELDDILDLAEALDTDLSDLEEKINGDIRDELEALSDAS